MTQARTYVLDTSVLLSDPTALHRFEEHDVVLPLVVLSELEAKRHHPELGWAARQTLRALEDLRVKHGTLLDRLPITEFSRLPTTSSERAPPWCLSPRTFLSD